MDSENIGTVSSCGLMRACELREAKRQVWNLGCASLWAEGKGGQAHFGIKLSKWFAEFFCLIWDLMIALAVKFTPCLEAAALLQLPWMSNPFSFQLQISWTSHWQVAHVKVLPVSSTGLLLILNLFWKPTLFHVDIARLWIMKFHCDRPLLSVCYMMDLIFSCGRLLIFSELTIQRA